MKRVCAVSGEEFEIPAEDLVFYEKMGTTPPTLCPRERLRRRMAYRNFRSLYHRTCPVTGKRILSMYSDDKPFPVYEFDYWWSDNWDATAYGREFDFSRPFFEQYEELNKAVPRFPIMNTHSENCLFSNFAFYSKNCYLIFGSINNQDCFYGHIVWDCENCVDNLYAYQCQWCSNSVDIVGCYDVHYSTECVHCQESYFCHDCRNCQNCFGCTNLRNKQYYIFNEPQTRDDYRRKIQSLFPLTGNRVDEITAWLEEEKRKTVLYPPAFSSQTEKTSGNHNYFSQNLSFCFDVKKGEDARYCFTVQQVSNSFDMSFGSGRFSLEGVAVLNSEQCLFCHTVADSQDLTYSEFCFASHDLFGCNGLRRKEYCILNKQYSKTDYLKLSQQIIAHMRKTGEWGEFFPIERSPFAYNESIVSEYLPLSRKEVHARGLAWKDSLDIPNGNSNAGHNLPQTIDEAADDVLGKTFSCAQTGKPYKLIAAELAFYRKTNLPLPRLCPEARHLNRMKLRQPRSLWPRSCPRCNTEFSTAFPPDAPHTVLCETCYLSQVQ